MKDLDPALLAQAIIEARKRRAATALLSLGNKTEDEIHDLFRQQLQASQTALEQELHQGAVNIDTLADVLNHTSLLLLAEEVVTPDLVLTLPREVTEFPLVTSSVKGTGRMREGERLVAPVELGEYGTLHFDVSSGYPELPIRYGGIASSQEGGMEFLFDYVIDAKGRPWLDSLGRQKETPNSTCLVPVSEFQLLHALKGTPEQAVVRSFLHPPEGEVQGLVPPVSGSQKP